MGQYWVFGLPTSALLMMQSICLSQNCRHEKRNSEDKSENRSPSLFLLSPCWMILGVKEQRLPKKRHTRQQCMSCLEHFYMYPPKLLLAPVRALGARQGVLGRSDQLIAFMLPCDNNASAGLKLRDKNYIEKHIINSLYYYFIIDQTNNEEIMIIISDSTSLPYCLNHTSWDDHSALQRYHKISSSRRLLNIPVVSCCAPSSITLFGCCWHL